MGKFKWIFWGLVFVAIIAATMLSSCTTKKGAVKWLNKNPLEASKFCMDTYPTKTEYKQGEVVIKRDTLTLAGEVKECPPAKNDTVTGKAEKVYVQCPPTKTITEWKVRVDTLRLKDSACYTQNRIVGETLKATQEDLARVKNGKHNWMLIAIGLGLLWVAFIAIKIFGKK